MQTEFRAKGVVWDFDGTLMDSFGLYKSGVTDALTRLGMSIPADEVFVHNYHGRLRDSIQAVCGVHGALLEEIYEVFVRSEERHYKHPDNLYFADAINLLHRTHAVGVLQIIISNRAHQGDDYLGSPRNLAQRSPLAGCIESVVCGDDNQEFHKPDARVLDSTELQLGLRRSDLLVVGDQFVDAELARNLGCRAVIIARNSEQMPHLDRLADGWQEHVTIVRSLAEVAILPA